MITAILGRPTDIRQELIGPYVPPSDEEILADVNGLEPVLKASALLALGKAALEIHQLALERAVGEERAVEIPASVINAKIAGEYGVNEMVKARTAARCALQAGLGSPPMTYSIVPSGGK